MIFFHTDLTQPSCMFSFPFYVNRIPLTICNYGDHCRLHVARTCTKWDSKWLGHHGNICIEISKRWHANPSPIWPIRLSSKGRGTTMANPWKRENYSHGQTVRYLQISHEFCSCCFWRLLVRFAWVREIKIHWTLAETLLLCPNGGTSSFYLD